MPKPAIVAAVLGATAQATIVNSHRGKPVPPRPHIAPYPLSPGAPLLASPAREPTKYCFVKPSCSNYDDAHNILGGFEACNNGGTVVLDGNYTIASPLDLTFLNAIDVILTGNITFDNDMYRWTEMTLKFPYQNSSAFWRIGGKDVNIYGGGTIDGQGQVWWDECRINKTLARPHLFVLDGLVGGTVSNLRLINSPKWFNFIANSSQVMVDDIYIYAHSTSDNSPANSDGWDLYRTDTAVIQNSIIWNNDDCVSFKPNSTNIVIQNLNCTGSHGISVGSLGQYRDEIDIVENVTVYSINMTNASDGARIKVWPGIQTSFQADLNGGGGGGWVRNVTYDHIHNHDNEWAIELTQCYGQSNKTLCSLYPSNMTLSDIVLKNMDGTTSTKHDPKIGSLICSDPSRCNNISAHNISVTPPNGKAPQFICTNMDDSLLDVECVAS